MGCAIQWTRRQPDTTVRCGRGNIIGNSDNNDNSRPCYIFSWNEYNNYNNNNYHNSEPRPPPPTRLVTSRNLKGVNLADFQADVRTLIGSMEDLRGPDLGIEGLVHVYNDGMLQILDRHAPSVTRRVRDRPTAPVVDG
nr:hypothetical protein BaRGS_011792 [Batillaria attramentaria]